MKFSKTLLTSALTLAISFTASSAHANSSASAFLSFSVLSTGGFAWSVDPELASSASSDIVAADLTGYEDAAGVFNPAYGPASMANDFAIGTAVPSTAAVSTGTTTVANAQTFTGPSQVFSSLSAFALVPTSGTSSATAFSRSYFTLDAGASVTFQGALFLTTVGSNPAFPANYNVGEFYGFATGLLEVSGGGLVENTVGGPDATSLVGNYNLSDADLITLSYTNTTNAAITTYLDSGVSVYSASALAPVPEPSTYAMLLAGLCALGFVAARRQSND